MRSIHVLGVTAVALSLGMAGALAGPTSNLHLLAAQATSSASGLPQLANSNDSTHPAGSTSHHGNLVARVGDLRAGALVARFVPNRGRGQAVLDDLRQPASAKPTGLSGLDAAAAQQAASLGLQRLASATAVARPNRTGQALSSLFSR
jgi:hypothetical protein